MCCARVTSLQLKLSLSVIESLRRQQNTSGGYKSSGENR